MTPEETARLFHETYERLAPSHGYETRKASAVPWEDVPEPNRSLMVAVAGEVSQQIEAAVRQTLAGEVEALCPDFDVPHAADHCDLKIAARHIRGER